MTLQVSRFRAMNTDISFLTPHTGRESGCAGDIVRQVFEEIEEGLSRFRLGSELCALNRASGTVFHASSLLCEAVHLALWAARATNGMFDPTILPALEEAGYDRSFEQMREGRHPTGVGTIARGLVDFRTVECDLEQRTIRMAEGQHIDLGGIGKGLAVDRALAATTFLGDRCIAAGGDIAVRGEAGSGEPWIVALDDTGLLAPMSIAVHEAAVATSTVTKRRWRSGDREQHHLIDPRTGSPSTSPLRTVTVVAESCVQADVAAKTALLLGEAGMEFLECRGVYGFGVLHDGRSVTTRTWPVVHG